MPKNIDEFIVPERKRSIRDIPIPDGRRALGVKLGPSDKKPKKMSDEMERPDLSTMPPPPPRDLPKERSGLSSGGKKKIVLSLAVGLLVVIFGLLSFFSGATISYLPKSMSLSFVNEAFSAYRAGERAPIFSVLKVSLEESLSVPSTGEREVSRKASGTIIVYNNATSESQRLIATTRFETPNGLVYRIENPIVVPGRRTVNGTIQPGSVEVVVYADETGDEYNIGLSDFSLPGLRGTPRYDTIYARSKTPMSGGFEGVERVVEESVLQASRSTLEERLKDRLLAEALRQSPSDLVLIPTLSSWDFEGLTQTPAESAGNVTLNLKGHLNGVMFKRNELAKTLGSRKTSLSSGDMVDFENFENLTFNFIGLRPADLLAVEEISFTVTGDSRMVWKTDEVSLKADLSGRHKRELASILNNYPSVLEASATVRPFWKSTFPEKQADIQLRKLPVQ